MTDNGNIILSSWIMQFLPYVNINKTLNPYVNEFGLFVQIGDYPDYSSIYTKLSIYVNEELNRMYNMGYVYLPSKHVIDNWYLVPPNISSSTSEIYYPMWEDNRITKTSGDIHSFIHDRINGIEYINYYVGENKVVHHTLAKLIMIQFDRLVKIVNSQYIQVTVNNLKEGQQIASLIEYATVNTSGIIDIKYVTSMSDVNIYEGIEKNNREIFGIDSIVHYKTEDIQRPYAVSFLFKYNININMRSVSYKLWKMFETYRFNIDSQIVVEEEKVKTINTFVVKNIVPFKDIDFIPSIYVKSRKLFANEYVTLKGKPLKDTEIIKITERPEPITIFEEKSLVIPEPPKLFKQTTINTIDKSLPKLWNDLSLIP